MVTWFLENEGLGPAVVEWFAVTVEGTPLRSWEEMAELSFGGTSFSVAHFAPSHVYQPGAEVKLLEVSSLDEGFTFKRVKIEACYCSTIFPGCWTTADPNADSPREPSGSCREQRPEVVLYEGA